MVSAAAWDLQPGARGQKKPPVHSKGANLLWGRICGDAPRQDAAPPPLLGQWTEENPPAVTPQGANLTMILRNAGHESRTDRGAPVLVDIILRLHPIWDSLG